MVLPQFSLRMALGLMAVLGFVSLLISRGLQGSTWAMGVSVALAALVFAFVTYAVVYGLVYAVWKTFNGRATPSRGTPAQAADARSLSTEPRDNTDLAPPVTEAF